MGNALTLHFIETIGGYERKVGICIRLCECMKRYEYQWSMSVLTNVTQRFTFKRLLLQSCYATFHLKLLWVGRIKVCSNWLGHVTNMAAMPIYVKTH